MATDYYPLLSRAIATLDDNTPAARQAVYERSRRMVENHLQAKTPPLSAANIEAEQSALEYAIWRIEMESESPSARPMDRLTPEDLVAPTDEERMVRPGWRNIGPGLLLIALAGAALYATNDLPGRRGFALGPGTMPSVLSAILCVLGIAAAVEGLFRGRIYLPASIIPVIIVSAAGLVFILAVNYVGLAVATCIMTATVAGYSLRRRYVAFAAVVVTSVVAFVLLELVRLLSSQ